ncbi:hypothetical protein ACFOOJ_13500 [Sphingobium xenophagum]|nr:RNA-directed DNA polymerase [Sphingobium xenophagum]
MADGLFDQAELAEFELNLEAELEGIRSDFAEWKYTCAPLRLVPQPKKPDAQGKPRFRQYFQLAVRDQVAWIALANVLGPEMDKRMPAWSYGNRLYRAAWYEQSAPDEPHSKLNIGPYRHSGGNLYRHFKHSWPLYRRHISLTARRMVSATIDEGELDAGERLALKQSEGLAYLAPEHWSKPTPADDKIFAASLDLSKFYPSVRKAAIAMSFASFLPGYTDELASLIDQMLTFTVQTEGVSEETKSEVVPPVNPGIFERIPTGLFVGGFLANVAMLPVDLEVETLLAARRDIAHFRFVDDHEILAYDFESLVSWLSLYAELLAKHDIGAEIEPDKYVPPELKWILHRDEELPPGEKIEDLIQRASSAAAVNGRKPTELMTRTLAQVSMLAATDFDLLTDSGRGQRMEQLEWLLLANIPDQEIRGDTRMAFAAAQIAALTPSLFRPSDKLLVAHRRLAALSKKSNDDALLAEIASLKTDVETLEEDERKEWSTLLKRHFALLFEAFSTHPDKVRLFTRLLDFCRATGHDGLPQIVAWMRGNERGQLRLLKCYLGSTGLQALARHVLTASESATRLDALHRERAAARSFISNLLSAQLETFVPTAERAEPLQFFQWNALTAFAAALVIGAVELEAIEPDLARNMRDRAGSLGLGEEIQGVADLARSTGTELGVWYHWFFSTTLAYRNSAPDYWPLVAEAHRPSKPTDWNSLRRYPRLLPDSGWQYISENPAALKPDDAGWLLDAAHAAPDRLAGIVNENAAVIAAKRHLAATPGRSLTRWVEFASALPASDPRRSEWTALEVIRQIVEPLSAIDGPDADILDDLHPENICIPEIWFNAADILDGGKLTWEGWRRKSREDKVKLIDPPIRDYRYAGMLDRADRAWPKRLRPIGQLLWGMLRQSFALPAAWNIRGQERSLLDIVGSDLERLPISSFTLTILQSCLLPRNAETSLLHVFPPLFGNLAGLAADDTEFDTPINTSEELEVLLGDAQHMLELSQMTVLEHQPRQLIPVRLRHLGAFGAEHAPEHELHA